MRLSRGGSDAVVLREFDLTSKAFVTDGFVLPEAKGWVSWLDPDTLLLSSAWGGDVTTSGYARTVRLWRRGTDAGAGAGSVRGAAREHVGRRGRRPRAQRRSSSGIVEYVGFFDVNLWMADGEGGNRVKLDLPTDIEMLTHHGWMAIKPRKAWTVAGKTWPADTLLGIAA